MTPEEQAAENALQGLKRKAPAPAPVQAAAAPASEEEVALRALQGLKRKAPRAPEVEAPPPPRNPALDMVPLVQKRVNEISQHLQTSIIDPLYEQRLKESEAAGRAFLSDPKPEVFNKFVSIEKANAEFAKKQAETERVIQTAENYNADTSLPNEVARAEIESTIDELFPPQSAQPDNKIDDTEAGIVATMTGAMGPAGATPEAALQALEVVDQREQQAVDRAADPGYRPGFEILDGVEPRFENSPLNFPQTLELADRASAVNPEMQPLPDYTPEDLTGEDIAWIEEEELPEWMREVFREIKSQVLEVAQSTNSGEPEEWTGYRSPFIDDGTAKLRQVAVDPLELALVASSGFGQKGNLPAIRRALEQLYVLKTVRQTPTADGGYYTSTSQVPADQMAAIQAEASRAADAKVAGISGAYWNTNQLAMIDAKEFTEKAEWWGPLLAPVRAMMSPGSYTVFKEGEERQPVPVLAQEGFASWTLRGTLSTMIGPWLLDEKSTPELGGEFGWGGKRHLEKIIYYYNMSDDFPSMRDNFRERYGLLPEDGAFFYNVFPTAMTTLPAMGVMIFEPDVFSVSTGMLGYPIQLGRRLMKGMDLGIARGVASTIDATHVARLRQELIDNGPEALIARARASPGSTEALLAEAVLADSSLEMINRAMDVAPNDLNPLPVVSEAEVAARSVTAGERPSPPTPKLAQDLAVPRTSKVRMDQKVLDRRTFYNNRVKQLRQQRNDMLGQIEQTIDAVQDPAVKQLAKDLFAKAKGRSLDLDLKVQQLAKAARLTRRVMRDPGVDLPSLEKAAGAPRPRRGIVNPATINFLDLVDAKVVLGDLFMNKRELFSLLSEAGKLIKANDALKASDAVKKFANERIMGELSARINKARASIISNLPTLELARIAAEYAEIESMSAKAAEDLANVMQADKTMARRLKALRKLERQLAQTFSNLEMVNKIDEGMSDLKGIMLDTIDRYSAAFQEIALRGAPEAPKITKFIYADHIEAIDGTQVMFNANNYLARIRNDFPESALDVTIDSPIGRIIERLARLSVEEAVVRLEGYELDHLLAFEEALGMEVWRQFELPKTARGQNFLEKLKNWKFDFANTTRPMDEIGPAQDGVSQWRRGPAGALVDVLTGRESWQVLGYQMINTAIRRLDVVGAGPAGKMSQQAQELVRRGITRAGVLAAHIDAIGGARAVRADGTPLSRNQAVRDFLTTHNVYVYHSTRLNPSGRYTIPYNQDALTPLQKAFSYLRWIANDSSTTDLAFTAIMAAPLKSFDSIRTRPLGEVAAVLRRILANSPNAETFLQNVHPELVSAFVRQKGGSDVDAVVDTFILGAIAHASTQYDMMLDQMRLFGPGINAEYIRALNWMQSPSRADFAVGPVDAVHSASAAYGMPMASDMVGSVSGWLPRLLSESRSATELLRRASIEGYGVYIPKPIVDAINESHLRIAKELSEFSAPSTPLDSAIRALGNYLRWVNFTLIHGLYYFSYRLVTQDYIGGLSNALVESRPLRRVGQMAAGTAPKLIPFIGTPIQRFFFRLGQQNTIIGHMFDPIVGRLMHGDPDELIQIPTTGETTTIARLAREVAEQGASGSSFSTGSLRQELHAARVHGQRTDAIRAQIQGTPAPLSTAVPPPPPVPAPRPLRPAPVLPPPRQPATVPGMSAPPASTAGSLRAQTAPPPPPGPTPITAWLGWLRKNKTQNDPILLVKPQNDLQQELLDAYVNFKRVLQESFGSAWGDLVDDPTRAWSDADFEAYIAAPDTNPAVKLAAARLNLAISKNMQSNVPSPFDPYISPPAYRREMSAPPAPPRIYPTAQGMSAPPPPPRSPEVAPPAADPNAPPPVLPLPPRSVEPLAQINPIDDPLAEGPTLVPTGPAPSVPAMDAPVPPGPGPARPGVAPFDPNVPPNPRSALTMPGARASSTVVSPQNIDTVVPRNTPTVPNPALQNVPWGPNQGPVDPNLPRETIQPMPPGAGPQPRQLTRMHRALAIAGLVMRNLGITMSEPPRMFAEWVDNVFTSTRTIYYMRRRLEGMSPAQAGEATRRALGDWINGVPLQEIQALGLVFAVWRYARLSLRHMSNMALDGLVGPEGMSFWKVATNQTQIGRARQADEIYRNRNNIYSWNDEEFERDLDDEQQFRAWAERKLPWRSGGKVSFGIFDVTKENQVELRSLTGRPYRFADVHMEGIQALDELYMFYAFNQAAVGSAIYASKQVGMFPSFTMVDEASELGQFNQIVTPMIDEFAGMLDQRWSGVVREMATLAITNNTTPDNRNGYTVPKDWHVAMKVITQWYPHWRDNYGWIEETPEGEYRVDNFTLPMFRMLVTAIPAATDAVRLTSDVAVPLAANDDLATALAEFAGEYTGLVRVEGFDPALSHDRDARNRANQLEEAVRQADDAARKKSEQRYIRRD